MPRDRFMFFENFKATAEMLDDKNRLAFYDALCDYVFKDVEPQDPYIAALLNAVRPSLDKTDRRGGARQGAGAPKGNTNALKSETIKNNQKQSNQPKTIILSETETETEIKETEKEIHKEKESDVFVAELERQELEKVKSKTDDDFDRFWAAYTPVRCSDGRVVPKGAKKEARAKFDKYIKAGVKADDIIDGAKKYLSSCQANDRLSCGATVFLNQERWKDDWSAQGIQATRKTKSISSPDYVGEGSFLRRAEDDPFCADL